MTRRITETFYGFDMPDVLVTISTDSEDAGEHRGELRAWALDDATGEWWGFCQYRVRPGRQLLGWIHETGLRRDAELTDHDGLLDPGQIVALPHRDT